MFARDWHCFSDDYEAVAYPITIEIAHGHLVPVLSVDKIRSVLAFQFCRITLLSGKSLHVVALQLHPLDACFLSGGSFAFWWLFWR